MDFDPWTSTRELASQTALLDRYPSLLATDTANVVVWAYPGCADIWCQRPDYLDRLHRPMSFGLHDAAGWNASTHKART